jgi:glycosyltransferase involved in cell wall biosynthesis
MKQRLFQFFNNTLITIRNNVRRNIYYITDRANWSFYWVGYYITKGLNRISGVHSYLATDPWSYKNQILHFGDRYAYLHGPFKQLAPSNQVFLTWFHGTPDDPDKNISSLFHILPRTVDLLKKIVVSCKISQQILVDCGIDAAKVVKIPLGIDLARFFPLSEAKRFSLRKQMGIPTNAICVGSFQKDGIGWGDGFEPKLIKGPDIFVKVIANIFREHKNLYVILTGPARGYIKEGLKKSGITFGHYNLANYHDIVQLYQILDMYLITSRSEGGPQALLESWATGVPVVSTNVGMAADLIVHGKNGMLANVEDVTALTEHASSLIEDFSLRETCRKNALEEVKNYDWNIIAEQYYTNLYKPFLD